MLLSALFVRYRDIEPIWDVVLQILFYVTPIFYTVDARPREASERSRTLMHAQPVRGDAPAGAPRVHRPAPPEPRPPRSGGDCCCSCRRCAITVVARASAATRLRPRGAADRRGALAPSQAAARDAEGRARRRAGRRPGAGRRARRGTARPCAARARARRATRCASRRRRLRGWRSEVPAALELEVVDARTPGRGSGSAARWPRDGPAARCRQHAVLEARVRLVVDVDRRSSARP